MANSDDFDGKSDGKINERHFGKKRTRFSISRARERERERERF